MNTPHVHSASLPDDPTELFLWRMRERALASALCAATLALPSCTSSARPEIKHPASGHALACKEAGGGFPFEAAGMSAPGADYLALRYVRLDRNEQGDVDAWTRSDFRVLSERGTPCGAAPTAACEDKLAKHPAGMVAASCVQVCSELSVVATHGEEVRRYATPEELRALLSPVDTEDEALLLVRAEGYEFRCDDASRGAIQVASNGYDVRALRMTQTCPIALEAHDLHVSSSGEVTLLHSEPLPSDPPMCVGRRSPTLPRQRTGDDSFARFLAASAELEAASVTAFEQLDAALAQYGAPASLRALVVRAQHDEVRHARVMTSLARAHGAEVRALEAAERVLPGLEELARENAVEGCVRETYGALVGALQAEQAGEARLRRVMRPVARDELSHAALSWKIHAWALAQLSPAARGRVRAAMQKAWDELTREAERPVQEALRARAGLPTSEQARAMLGVLRDESCSAAFLACA